MEYYITLEDDMSSKEEIRSTLVFTQWDMLKDKSAGQTIYLDIRKNHRNHFYYLKTTSYFHSVDTDAPSN